MLNLTAMGTDKEKLASQMVHDVRTPLTVLGMLCVTLQDHLPKVPEMRDELAILKAEIVKIDKIVSKYRAAVREAEKK